jgi:hypothetical protein
MITPHLRIGEEGAHDTGREAFCAFAADPPVEPAFLYTGGDPADVPGEDLASLREAAFDRCGCGESRFTLIAEDAAFGGGGAAFDGLAPSLDQDGRVAFRARASDGFLAAFAASEAQATREEYLQLTRVAGQAAVVEFQLGSFAGGRLAFSGSLAGVPGIFSTSGGPIETEIADPGVATGEGPSMNAAGVVALVLGDELLRADGGSVEVLQRTRTIPGCCQPEDLDRIDGFPAINGAGSVGFFGSFEEPGSGCDDFALRSDGAALVRVAGGGVLSGCSGVFHSADHARPFALSGAGHVAFTGATDTEPSFAAVFVGSATLASRQGGQFLGFEDVAVNAAGRAAFLAYRMPAAGSGSGIFTGPDAVADKVIATGDPLFGSTVTGLAFDRDGLNDAGQIAFRAQLADGRHVVVRAEP